MPHRLNIKIWRGDTHPIAIPLLQSDETPFPAEKIADVQSKYPIIRAQFRRLSEYGCHDEIIFELSNADNSIELIPDYALPEHTGPALVFNFKPTHTAQTLWAAYDLQFSGGSAGIFTWLAGELTIQPDITRDAIP